MFTGLVEKTAAIKDIRIHTVSGKQNATVILQSTFPAEIGDSIAVNGCCLTVDRIEGDLFSFELSSETLAATNLCAIKVGSIVNLERALPMGGRLGGHLVSGHIDCTARVAAVEPTGDFTKFTIHIPKDSEPYLITKGSICVNGVSLTINELKSEKEHIAVDMMLIPETLKSTNLAGIHVLDTVNVELDMVGKYIFKQRSLSSFLEMSRNPAI